MKITSKILAAAIALLPGIAHADYRYTFNLTGSVTGQTGNFSFVSPILLTTSGLIPTSTFESCNLYASNGASLACGANIGFYNDSSSQTSGVDAYDAISFGTGVLGGNVTYFNNGSFAQAGTYSSSTIVPNIGTLSISQIAAAGAVPEPATWGMMIVGFGVAGAAMRRRRERVAVRFA